MREAPESLTRAGGRRRKIDGDKFGPLKIPIRLVIPKESRPRAKSHPKSAVCKLCGNRCGTKFDGFSLVIFSVSGT